MELSLDVLAGELGLLLGSITVRRHGPVVE